MSEKLCLKWNDYQDNVNAAFGNLREDKEFADVTLACEDGQLLEAHKVILAASSPFFQSLLTKSRHPHPVIFMKGVKFENLAAIVDFLYCGEANVFQENLDAFLSIAEELKLKGLSGQEDMREDNIEQNQREMALKPTFKRKNANANAQHQKSFLNKDQAISELSQEGTVSLQNVPEDLKGLDEKVKSMVEKSQNMLPDGRRAYVCKVCGKEGYGTSIRDHIEANHLEGVSLPCNICHKTFRSRMSLRKHKCT